KNRSFIAGAGVTKEVITPHTSDGGVDDRQSYNGPSPVPSRYDSSSLSATEVSTDHQ
ncbi:hypothetical protein HAX54_043441, partial [Datura stramonium]|nr:hypothetical protein [Datura stramonium]